MVTTLQKEPFTALADVYKISGLSAYSTQLASQLLDFLYNQSWEGSRMLDLATGIGEVPCWFATQRVRAVGVDSSAAMLKHARQQAESQGLAATFVQADIRTYQPDQPADLVLCLGGSLNYLPSLNDLGAVFRVAAAACVRGKPFIFDLHTIQGLSRTPAERILSEGEQHFIATRNAFSYETLSLSTRYTIFHYTSAWQRAEETHILRGYPVQAVQRLLSSSGFALEQTLTLDFAPITAVTNDDMLLFVARRV
ncbi:MAG: class I SAM-dependent methyltransferase [Anaerolineae bacterium]|nr:class I SAM-dependent methyltransferase [Anaerolineae bacterium]MDW8299178.1 class I SAM-dependent methyltransferase [Anaerolineae bacterium]